MNLAAIKSVPKIIGRNVTKIAYKTGIVQHAPEILLGIGITSILGGSGLACYKTIKMEEIIDEVKEAKEGIAEVEDLVENSEFEITYTPEDKKKDLTKIYFKATSKTLKNYIAPVSLIGIGIGCIICSHNIMHSRYLAAVAAYDVCKEAYNKYRARIIEDHGEEYDQMVRYGIRAKEITDTVKDEKTGKTKKIKKTVYEMDETGLSPYAKLYSPSTTPCCEAARDWGMDGYSRNAMMAAREYNKTFILKREAEANERLRREGHLFLNDVYEMLGFEDTSDGAITGWIWVTDEYGNYCGPGEGRVRFGILNDSFSEKEAWPGKYDDAIWLDFNVDGIIYDLLRDNDPFCGTRHREFLG